LWEGIPLVSVLRNALSHAIRRFSCPVFTGMDQPFYSGGRIIDVVSC
jgi:hypothetical protein